jgi:hypothetical protein
VDVHRHTHPPRHRPAHRAQERQQQQEQLADSCFARGIMVLDFLCWVASSSTRLLLCLLLMILFATIAFGSIHF